MNSEQLKQQLKTKKAICPICGTIFQINARNHRYCSRACKDKDYHTRHITLKKQRQDPMHDIQTGKLDEALKEAKKQNLSYAEYQKAKTIQLIRQGKL